MNIPGNVVVTGSTIQTNAWTVVLVMLVIVPTIFFIWLFTNSKQLFRTTTAILTCPLNMCATNIYNGDKRCSSNSTIPVLYDPTFEVCNSEFSCDNQRTPFAVNSDGSTNPLGICQISPIDNVAQTCRCVQNPTCGFDVQSMFNQTIGGVITPTYVTPSGTTDEVINSGNFTPQTFAQEQIIPGIVPVQFGYCAIKVNHLDRTTPRTSFCTFNQPDNPANDEMWRCVNSNPCTFGVLAFRPFNDLTFGIAEVDQYFNTPVGCEIFVNNPALQPNYRQYLLEVGDYTGSAVIINPFTLLPADPATFYIPVPDIPSAPLPFENTSNRLTSENINELPLANDLFQAGIVANTPYCQPQLNSQNNEFAKIYLPVWSSHSSSVTCLDVSEAFTNTITTPSIDGFANLLEAINSNLSTTSINLKSALLINPANVTFLEILGKLGYFRVGLENNTDFESRVTTQITIISRLIQIFSTSSVPGTLGNANMAFPTGPPGAPGVLPLDTNGIAGRVLPYYDLINYPELYVDMQMLLYVYQMKIYQYQLLFLYNMSLNENLDYQLSQNLILQFIASGALLDQERNITVSIEWLKYDFLLIMNNIDYYVVNGYPTSSTFSVNISGFPPLSYRVGFAFHELIRGYIEQSKEVDINDWDDFVTDVSTTLQGILIGYSTDPVLGPLMIQLDANEVGIQVTFNEFSAQKLTVDLNSYVTRTLIASTTNDPGMATTAPPDSGLDFLVLTWEVKYAVGFNRTTAISMVQTLYQVALDGCASWYDILARSYYINLVGEVNYFPDSTGTGPYSNMSYRWLLMVQIIMSSPLQIQFKQELISILSGNSLSYPCTGLLDPIAMRILYMIDPNPLTAYQQNLQINQILMNIRTTSKFNIQRLMLEIDPNLLGQLLVPVGYVNVSAPLPTLLEPYLSGTGAIPVPAGATYYDDFFSIAFLYYNQTKPVIEILILINSIDFNLNPNPDLNLLIFYEEAIENHETLNRPELSLALVNQILLGTTIPPGIPDNRIGRAQDAWKDLQNGIIHSNHLNSSFDKRSNIQVAFLVSSPSQAYISYAQQMFSLVQQYLVRLETQLQIYSGTNPITPSIQAAYTAARNAVLGYRNIIIYNLMQVFSNTTSIVVAYTVAAAGGIYDPSIKANYITQNRPYLVEITDAILGSHQTLVDFLGNILGLNPLLIERVVRVPLIMT